MARHGLFKGGPRLEQPTRKKTCTFTNQIEDTVKKIELGMYTEKNNEILPIK
jgi:hypothetical protein